MTEAAKKVHRVLRAAFTRKVQKLKGALEANNEDEIFAYFEDLKVNRENLSAQDKLIIEMMCAEAASEEALSIEEESHESYSTTYYQYVRKVDKKLADSKASEREDAVSCVSHMTSCSDGIATRRYRLPKIELTPFNGDIKDWIAFWSKFEKFDSDPHIDNADKIQYLLQSTVPKSRARRLVEAYPGVGDNYPKIIEAFKATFGREDLQIEIHIQELVKIILMNNAEKSADIATLYDSLYTEMRSLETLGLNSDKYAAIIYPLVENCLPEELLRLWQRTNEYSAGLGDSAVNVIAMMETRLANLMAFLNKEVQAEQRVKTSRQCLRLMSKTRKTTNSMRSEEKNDKQEATASSLLNKVDTCIFCDGKHTWNSCEKVARMTIDDRLIAVRAKGACFQCLRLGHRSNMCKSKKVSDTCKRRHASVLCKTEDNKSDCKALSNGSCHDVFLQTVRVVASWQGIRKSIRVLFDNGSHRSYIKSSVASELNVDSIRKEEFKHVLLGGTVTDKQSHNVYWIEIAHERKRFKLEVLEQKDISTNLTNVGDIGPRIEELKQMQITLSDCGGTGPIDMLIGADVMGKLLTGRKHELKSGPIALETEIGWTLLGKVPKSNRVDTTKIVYTSFLVDASIKKLWELDVLGIEDPQKRVSKEEAAIAAKKLFEETTRLNEEGRYEVRIPWLENHLHLPTNRSLAEKRLESTISKLMKINMVETYNTVFEEWKNEGIIEVVPENEFSKNRVHYLPHRPIIKEDRKTFKVRPVYDASAKVKGCPSLNDCVEKGANLIELIPKMLLQFRLNRIGIVSDIRKAFLQVSLHPEDTDVLRFLWEKDGKRIEYRHRRVVFGVNCSPFLLGATLEYHIKCCKEKVKNKQALYSMRTVDELTGSFYVDNCIKSFESIEAAMHFKKEAKIVMSEGSVDLRMWEYSGEGTDENSSTSVLGLNWNKYDDKIRFSDKCFYGELDKRITKRVILASVQRIYDPMGLATPVFLIPKLLLQSLWKSELTWDQEIGKDEAKKYLEWWEEAKNLLQIAIPRWLGGGPGRIYEYHVFCDASQVAYAAVIYLRIKYFDEVKVSLLAAKGRVAPKKEMTIPRLELMGATIASRLFVVVKNGLKIEGDAYFWSDSTTVIAWIQRSEEWAAFVGNGVKEIRRLPNVNSWRHVPGQMNPADVASRGCSAKQLIESNWWEGPNWLCEEENNWPSNAVDCEEELVKAERKKGIVYAMANTSSVRIT